MAVGASAAVAISVAVGVFVGTGKVTAVADSSGVVVTVVSFEDEVASATGSSEVVFESVLLFEPIASVKNP